VDLKKALIDRFNGRFARLGQPLLSKYTMILVPTEVLHSAALTVVAGSKWPNCAAALVLQVIGPWQRTDGWAVHHSIEALVSDLKRCFEVAADKYGVIPKGIVEELLRCLFCEESDLQKYAKQILGLSRTCGQWTIRDTHKCRIAAALRFLGQPATKDEVAALTGLSTLNVGSTFGTIEGVVRADRYRWGFEEWIDDAYDGIFGEIIQRIEDCGGCVSVHILLRDIPSQFGVSEASVKAYLASDAFTIKDQSVRKADDVYIPKVPEECAGAVRVGDHWGQRVPLHDRHFKGYSLGVYFDIAYANGVRPDDDLIVPVVGSHYEASVIWRRHSVNRLIDVGRVSDFLESAGYQGGDEVVVIPGPDCVEILTIAQVESRLANDVVNQPDQIHDDDSHESNVNDPLLDLLDG
jgi:hypothetical protein